MIRLSDLIYAVAAALLLSLAALLFRHRQWLIGIPRCLLFERHRRLRVSFSALLHLRWTDQYVLLKMARRPEGFGPFGGVYKIFNAASAELGELGFTPQETHRIGDLRGFILAKDLLRMLAWFSRGQNREAAGDCLRREIKEELAELDLNALVAMVDGLRFTSMRVVHEGPKPVSGFDYLQIRQFDVLDIPHDEGSNALFCENVVTAAANHPGLLMASADEIRRGRSRGKLIGSQAQYLFSAKSVRPDLPPFSD